MVIGEGGGEVGAGTLTRLLQAAMILVMVGWWYETLFVPKTSRFDILNRWCTCLGHSPHAIDNYSLSKF